MSDAVTNEIIRIANNYSNQISTRGTQSSQKEQSIFDEANITTEAILKPAVSADRNKTGGTVAISKLDAQGNGTVTITTVTDDGKEYITTEYYKANRKMSLHVVVKNGGKVISRTGANFKYDKKGNCTKIESTTRGSDNKVVSTRTQTISYDENNRKINEKIVTKNSKGKELPEKSAEYNYKYNESGTLIETDIDYTLNGKEAKKVIEYEDDGKTVKKQTAEYCNRGAKFKDVYNGGANFENRNDALPDERIIYEEDGKTVKKKIVNKFDEDGIFIGREEYDKDGKLTKKEDFPREIDGKFGVAYQVGRGDCYFLASINALSQTEAGAEILKSNIQSNEDGSYTVKLPGAAIARQSLIDGTGGAELITTDGNKLNKLDEDKVYIKGEYTITKQELDDAMKQAGKKYSAGDKDVLLMELVYEKYREDTSKTVKENNLNPKKTKLIAGLDTGTSDDNLNGGWMEASMYILTGKQSTKYRCKNYNNLPTCYIDSDYQMHVADENGNVNLEEVKAMPVYDSEGNIDQMLETLKNDYKDGKLDDYTAAAAFKISRQEVNGKTVTNSGHAFSITGVDDKYVYLANPWSPDDKITMTIEDFKKSAAGMNLLNLKDKNSGSTGVNNNTNTPDGNQQSQQSPTIQEQPGSYTVQRGDNLWKIAKKHLGEGANATEIANFVQKIIAANPSIKNPNLILVGQVINLPE